MVSLIDKLAIQEVITRYSYTYDVQDAEGFAALFTEDAAVTRCSQHQSNVGLSGQLWYPDRRVEDWRQRPCP